MTRSGIAQQTLKLAEEFDDNSSDDSSDSVRSVITVKSIKKALNNQDFIQYSMDFVYISYELYRIFVSTLLILFIPQNCNGQICTITQNMSWNNTPHNIAICVNFSTLCIFSIHYLIEIKREKYLIQYLEVNPHNPRDTDSLQSIFELLPFDKKNKITDINFYYKSTSYIVFFLFIINYTVSCVSIYEKSLGYQTVIIVLTDMLFMMTKIYHLYFVINTENNIYFSAYLLDRIQFNDVSERLKEEGLHIKTHEQSDVELNYEEDLFYNSDI